jgi:ArsR family transcriptional regulator, cadmium/lead-responsive transcriptional repressor
VADASALAANLFRGFSDKTRLAILSELADRELQVTDPHARAGGLQASISGHLAGLKDCGLVVDRPQGRRTNRETDS